MRLLKSQSQIRRTVRLINSKVTAWLLAGDVLVVLLLAFFVYLQPQFVLKRFRSYEQFVALPDTRHVLRQVDSFEENAIRADLLMNDIPQNKFILMPEYSIVKKSLRACPQNKCDELGAKNKLCTEPNLETGGNIWCPKQIIRDRQFKNLETIEFKIYRRVFPRQYEKLLDDLDIHGSGNRRGFEQKSLFTMSGLDRLKTRLRWADKVKSFVAGSQFIAKIPFQELFFKIKVSGQVIPGLQKMQSYYQSHKQLLVVLVPV